VTELLAGELAYVNGLRRSYAAIKSALMESGQRESERPRKRTFMYSAIQDALMFRLYLRAKAYEVTHGRT
jgi:hypothetical protein